MAKNFKLLILGLLIFISSQFLISCSNKSTANKIKNEIVVSGRSITNKLNTPTVLFYYVDWCPYCKTTKPVIKKAIDLFSDRIFIYKVDMESNEGKELIDKFVDKSKGIGTPYMQFYNSQGQLMLDYTGPLNYKELTKKIWEAFNIKV